MTARLPDDQWLRVTADRCRLIYPEESLDHDIRALELAHLCAKVEIPEFLKKGKKAEDVPYITHLRASFFETAQDIASQILTYHDKPEVVERLAQELYDEATKRLGQLERGSNEKGERNGDKGGGFGDGGATA